MASIRKIPNSRFWIAQFRDASGNLMNRSTKIPAAGSGDSPADMRRNAINQKRQAQEIAQQFENVSRGHVSESHLRKVIVELANKVNPVRIEFPVTSDFLQTWLDNVRSTKSPGTIARYNGTLNAFLDTLGERKRTTIDNITPADIETFTRIRLTDGRSQSTVSTDLKTLNIPFALALRQGFIQVNPISAASTVNASREQRIPFSIQEVRSLLKAAQGTNWHTAILLGAFAGLRLGDSVELTWDQVDFSQKVLRLRPRKTSAKKVDLVIPLHPDLEAHLLALPSSDKPKSPVCPDLAGRKPSGRSGLSMQFQKVMQKAGIEQESIERSGTSGRAFNRRTFHSLRHTYVTLLESAGVAPDIRKKLAGHSDDKSHARYTHTEIETLRRAANALPRI